MDGHLGNPNKSNDHDEGDEEEPQTQEAEDDRLHVKVTSHPQRRYKTVASIFRWHSHPLVILLPSIMNSYTVCVALALAVAVVAEPPSGYSYNKPSGGGFAGFSGGGLSGGGGGYTAVSSGYQTSEGQHVDPALLEQVRQILLKEEASSSHGFSGGGYSGGPSTGYGAPSPQYGVPQSSYGVPQQYASRVVGIDLEGIKQAIQVAQYHQVSHQSFGGYPSGPSSSYGAPKSSYGAPF